MRFLLIGLALFLAAGCAHYPGSKAPPVTPGDMSSLEQPLNAKFASLAQPGRPIRLAVLTFTPARKEGSGENHFGPYLSGLFIEALGDQGNIRLFERSRLDAIAAEHSLALSGMINAEEARAIGGLAPIDYILTGEYTLLGSTLAVSSRIIDVVSGEIVSALSREIALKEEWRPMLAPAAAPAPPVAGPGDTCLPHQEAFRNKSSDLTTQALQDSLVNWAVTVPFDTACGRIHFEIMGLFKRLHLDPPLYRKFLVRTLSGLALPDGDYRAMDIIHYFGKTGEIGEEEWAAGLSALKNGGRYLHSYADELVYRPSLKKTSAGAYYKRLDQIMTIAEAGKIGKPLPLKFDRVFSGVLAGCGVHSSDSDSRCAVHLFERWKPKLSDSALVLERDNLENLYFREKDPQARRKLLSWIEEAYNAASPDKKWAGDMLDLMKKIRETGAGHRKDLVALSAACGANIRKAFPLIPYPSQKDEAIALCLDLDIDAPGLVPTLEELDERLFSDVPQVQMDAARHLEWYGGRAAPLEKKVVKLLRRAERLNYSGTTNLRWSLIGVLRNIRTQDPESIAELIKLLSSRDYCVPDSAQRALAASGKNAIMPLEKAFDSSETYIQIRIVEVLGLMGPSASSEAGFLNRILKTANSGHLKDAAEDALDKIRRENHKQGEP